MQRQEFSEPRPNAKRIILYLKFYCRPLEGLSHILNFIVCLLRDDVTSREVTTLVTNKPGMYSL